VSYSESGARPVFAALASVLVGLHLLAVTFAAVPTNRVSDAVAVQLDYLTPFFGQNWRLFAPNPIDEDRNLLVQGAYIDGDGDVQTTPWVDWTSVEQDVIEHRLVGGRAGYITTKMFGALGEEFGEMQPAQRSLAQRSSALTPPSWNVLRDSLTRAGTDVGNVDDYLRYDRAVARLATSVIVARSSREIIAVRYALREQDVVPYDARHGDSAERQAARPEATVRVSGWRTPTLGPGAERRGVAEFDRRHG
jgi:Family of unknown function (DUF5819)